VGNEVCHHHKDPSVNIFQGIIGPGCDKHTKQIACVGRLQRFYMLEKSAPCALAWLRLDAMLLIVNFSVFLWKTNCCVYKIFKAICPKSIKHNHIYFSLNMATFCGLNGQSSGHCYT